MVVMGENRISMDGAMSHASEARLVPWFIPPLCECGSRLVLADRNLLSDPRSLGHDGAYEGDVVWWDEWECLECQGGVYLDEPGEVLR